MPDWLSCELGASPEAAHDARERVVKLLKDQSHGEVADLAALLTSEIVTNAVLHGEAPILLDAQISDGRLRVAVHDAAGGSPLPTDASSDAISGRGLDIVASLAHAWGVEQSSAGFGKTVWFEVVL